MTLPDPTDAEIEAVAKAWRSPHCVKWPAKDDQQFWFVIETTRPYKVVSGPFQSDQVANEALFIMRCELVVTALDAHRVQASGDSDGEAVVIDYTNYRGERGFRRVLPLRWEFSETEWHPGKQWIMWARDVDKGVVRAFAMDCIHSWNREVGPDSHRALPTADREAIREALEMTRFLLADDLDYTAAKEKFVVNRLTAALALIGGPR